jgi:CPA1 family monovalent cation:H+ antiporter
MSRPEPRRSPAPHAAASALVTAVRRLYLPYPVLLVLAGLLLGALHEFSRPRLTQALLFSVFLPGLLFEAAWQIKLRDLWANRLTVFGLAVPGVLLSALLVALILPPLTQTLQTGSSLRWQDALVFGALISATDPIAVIGLFRTLHAPRRLLLLVEIESLLNDGTSIVFFTLSLSLLTGAAVSTGALLLAFLTVVGMAVLVGAAIGALAAALMRRLAYPPVWISVTLLAAYGSFQLADRLHYSGVIATVVAGMVCGSRTQLGQPGAPGCRANCMRFWKILAIALNSAVFLLIGLTVHLAVLRSYWLPILAAFLVVTTARAVVITANRALVQPTRERYPWRWTPVLIWGGLRGALPMVLALALAPGYALRDLIIAMTFGVAVLSIMIQGVTMLPLLRHSGLHEAP